MVEQKRDEWKHIKKFVLIMLISAIIIGFLVFFSWKFGLLGFVVFHIKSQSDFYAGNSTFNVTTITKISYAEGNSTFNVTQSTVYSSEEPLAISKAAEKPVTPAKALFDIASNLISPQINFGENLAAKISLINFGVPGRLNVTLYYAIADLQNNTILTEEETREVETQTEFIKTFELPSDIKSGEYELYIRLTYENQEAVSKNSFQIMPKEIRKAGIALRIWLLAGLALIFIITLAVILWKGRLQIRVKKGVKEPVAEREKYLSPLTMHKDRFEHLKGELKIRKPESIKAGKNAKILRKFSLKKGKVFLVRDKNDRVSFSMFKDLTSVLPGLGVVRIDPSTLGYSKDNVKFIWLSESEGENCINPSDVEDLYNEIRDFLKRQKEGIVLLQGIDYIIGGTNFKTLMKILRMLKDEISSANNLIIISFNQNLLNKEEAEKLKSEFNIIQR